MYGSNILKIAISYPNNLLEEKKIVENVIKSWNDMNSESKKIVLLSKDWEHNVSATQEKPAQEHINNSIIENADIVIGLLGVNIGTPTDKEASGTIEEIKLRIAQKKDVIVCFQEKTDEKVDEIDAEKLEEYKKFKKELSGKYIEFKNLDDLDKQLLINLSLLINEKYESNPIINVEPMVNSRKPKIDISWTLAIQNKNNAEWNFEKVDCINVKKIYNIAMMEIQNLESEKQWALDQEKKSKDLDYIDKLRQYGKEIDELIVSITHEKQKYNLLKSGVFTPISLIVANIGNNPASHITIRIELPSCLFVYSKEEAESIFFQDAPVRPVSTYSVRPVSTYPVSPLLKGFVGNKSILGISDISRGGAENYLLSKNSLLNTHEENAFSFYTSKNNSRFAFKNNSIIFNQSNLLHKNQITNYQDDIFYLYAQEDADLGEHQIEASIFCEEYEDWEETKLSINIYN